MISILKQTHKIFENRKLGIIWNKWNEEDTNRILYELYLEEQSNKQ